MSLLMISRDQWIRVVANPETSAESEASPLEEERKKKKKRRYVCVTCKKSFGSFQALGGHRANHTRWDWSHGSIGAEAPMIEGRHECNVCQKVFKSGQALGGHKRSHCKARSAAKKKKQPCQLPTVTQTE
ncbi:hypothetical protein QJS10_CPA01g00381 [Acorus calamus]|uniref:C2H2-type domain-containing protein n=1 Tax=Acorus calamus TaxID=4465 RepID=A0AAV9FNI9_ACOCL|nr:hypothetical protein QJS10_CPA01g00381 [Acorus calamus]